IQFAAQAIQAGVRAILPKSASVGEYAECFAHVRSGRMWVEHDLTQRLLTLRQAKLGNRERQLMALLAQGLKNKEIAWRLGISEGTVKVYLSRLFEKVGASDRFELALHALQGLVPDARDGFENLGVKPGQLPAVMPKVIVLDRVAA
ncbi:MAG: response regulator transcription factor, partial [Acidobacteriota bacterium]|nr:response regulator transcription factor [Acidobacteriota bacterium]